jgi:predicted phosphate transport protein (TIGR00153 family)
MSILRPRDNRFYLLFAEAAANVRHGAELLLAMLKDYTEVTAKAQAISAVEHTGDGLTQEIYRLLSRIFVTPLDREDIAAIASSLDDVLDLIEASADDFVLYHIETPLPPAIEMAQIIVHSTIQVQQAIACLKHLGKNRAILLEHLSAINRLEHEGDIIYRNAIQTLFRHPDAVLIIKWKQVYDHLERAIDRCEDVTDVLHGVLLKYA